MHLAGRVVLGSCSRSGILWTATGHATEEALQRGDEDLTSKRGGCKRPARQGAGGAYAPRRRAPQRGAAARGEQCRAARSTPPPDPMARGVAVTCCQGQSLRSPNP